MKNESKIFVIYVHQTTHKYLNDIYRYINSVHITHMTEGELVHTYN